MQVVPEGLCWDPVCIELPDWKYFLPIEKYFRLMEGVEVLPGGWKYFLSL